MISQIDSYGFMHQIPVVRQFAEPGFMPWNNGWDPFINYSIQMDPTYEYGYRPAEEPDNGDVVIDPKPVGCMTLVRLAISELEDDFTVADVVELMSQSGHEEEKIRGCVSQLTRKLGYYSSKVGRSCATFNRISRTDPSDKPVTTHVNE